jgi:hypothetical protein
MTGKALTIGGPLAVWFFAAYVVKTFAPQSWFDGSGAANITAAFVIAFVLALGVGPFLAGRFSK